MTLLVDDQVLAAHLRGLSPFPAGEAVFTTGYWYVRLCLAVHRRAGGSLSGPFGALPPARRRAAVADVLALPEDIGLLSLRHLAPRMAALADRHPPMNILSREAVAAAVELSATVVIAEGNENPALLAALATEDLHADVVTLS